MQVKFNEAVVDYEKGRELCSDIPAIHYNRATILYRMGKFQEAMEGFQVSLKQDPNNEEFILALKACKQCLQQ